MYKRLQTKVGDVDRYFSREFWGPLGLSLAHFVALEATEEDMARISIAATHAGPSTKDVGHETHPEVGVDGHSSRPATEAAAREEAPQTISPSSWPQV